jgi:hypothetical protein
LSSPKALRVKEPPVFPRLGDIRERSRAAFEEIINPAPSFCEGD